MKNQNVQKKSPSSRNSSVTLEAKAQTPTEKQTHGSPSSPSDFSPLNQSNARVLPASICSPSRVDRARTSDGREIRTHATRPASHDRDPLIIRLPDGPLVALQNKNPEARPVRTAPGRRVAGRDTGDRRRPAAFSHRARRAGALRNGAAFSCVSASRRHPSARWERRRRADAPPIEFDARSTFHAIPRILSHACVYVCA